MTQSASFSLGILVKLQWQTIAVSFHKSYTQLYRKKKGMLLTCTVAGFFGMHHLPKHLCDPHSALLPSPVFVRFNGREGIKQGQGDSSAFMLSGDTTRKWKTQSTRWECQEFRHNMIFSPSTMILQLIRMQNPFQYMPVLKTERKRRCDWHTFLGFLFHFRKEVVGCPSDAC